MALLSEDMQKPAAAGPSTDHKHVKVASGRSAFHYVDLCIRAFESGETEVEVSGLGSGTLSIALKLFSTVI